MINKYLETLELQPGATNKEIKTAYRKLAKRYHPDIHPGVGREKFLEISEAYNFLMEVGTTPASETLSNNYDPANAAFQEAIRRAREKAMHMANARKKNNLLALIKTNTLLRGIAVIILMANVGFVLDMLLPDQKSQLAINNIYNRSYGHDLVVFSNGVEMEVLSLKRHSYDEAVVRLSPILGKWKNATFYYDGIPERVEFTMITYSPVFTFLTIVIPVLFFFLRGMSNDSTNKLSWYLIYIFASIIQLALMLLYM